MSGSNDTVIYTKRQYSAVYKQLSPQAHPTYVCLLDTLDMANILWLYVSIHANHSLSGTQKFTYLKAQLERDTARAVANYAHSVALLEERYAHCTNWSILTWRHFFWKCHSQQTVLLAHIFSRTPSKVVFGDYPRYASLNTHMVNSITCCAWKMGYLTFSWK